MPGPDIIFTNARVVLADRVLPCGTVRVVGGRIAGIDEAPTRSAGAIDLCGDMLIPGLVELHTDHLEVHVEPRPSVRWNMHSAVLAYDAQIATAGITTVFDCHRVGFDADMPSDHMPALEAARTIAEVGAAGHLRAEHFAHLRCEVCSHNVLTGAEAMIASARIDLMSLMDHTPGHRQFRDIDKLRVYYRGKRGMTDDRLDAFFAERLRLHERNSVGHRQRLVELAHTHRIALASHDDTTLDHVEESRRDGASIVVGNSAIEAAAASHRAGIAVMMGAPNVVRGGSHSGNVAAEDLARRGTLDILSSDYIPASLLLAAFQLPQRIATITLPQAIAMVTATPARAAGFTDRGEIRSGARADLVRLAESDVPIVREVYREGRRVV
jgi:alpha-D-ribose 1-methylphosphonate 5-triphosphate diphosphatase